MSDPQGSDELLSTKESSNGRSASGTAATTFVRRLVEWRPVLRRAANFAAARPAREVLFTVLSREDKYKAKSFLDTFIYRTGDFWVNGF
jgi:ATP/ADP translocase